MTEFKVLAGIAPAVGLSDAAIKQCISATSDDRFPTSGPRPFEALSFPDRETLCARFPKDKFPNLASGGHRHEDERGKITYYSLLEWAGDTWRAPETDPR